MKYFDTDRVSDLEDKVPTNFWDQNNRRHMGTCTVSFGLDGKLNPADDDPCNSDPDHRSYPVWTDPFCDNSPSIDEGVTFFVEGSPAPVYKSYFKAGDLVGCDLYR